MRGGPGQTFRIAAMDCSAEESDIRRALEPVAGIRSLGFQLGARTLRIDAPADVIPQALAAIRAAGYQPEALDATEAGDTHDHSAPAGGIPRMVAALALAIAAELVSFLAPGDSLPWRGIGMAVVVTPDNVAAATALLAEHGETVCRIGHIEAGSGPAAVRIDGLKPGWPG